MRILHVTDCYLPDLGGIEMHVDDLAQRQRARGHDVQVLTCTPAAPMGAVAARESVPTTRIRSTGPFGAAWAIRELLRTDPFDIVHSHLSVGSPFAWSALRARRPDASVATLHSFAPPMTAMLRAGVPLTGMPVRDVVWTAVSDAAARPIRVAFPYLRVGVLPNGIDPHVWACDPLPDRADQFTVVSVGRFTRRKRPRAAVRMLAALRDRLPAHIALRAILVGDGPQHAAARRDVERAGLTGQVLLPGALSREEIHGVLRGADAYLAPAHLESFGIAALEARCAGVPVIAMARSGVTEFVTDACEGLLVADDTAMVDAMYDLATHPALRRGIAEHNRTTEPPMTWDRVLDQHEELYQVAEAAAGSSKRLLGSVGS